MFRTASCLLALAIFNLPALAQPPAPTASPTPGAQPTRYFLIKPLQDSTPLAARGEVVIATQTTVDGQLTYQRLLYRFRDGLRAVVRFQGSRLDGLPTCGSILLVNTGQWISFNRTAGADLWATSLHPKRTKGRGELTAEEHYEIALVIQQVRAHVAGRTSGFAPVRSQLDALADSFAKMGEPVAPLAIEECSVQPGSPEAGRIEAIELEFARRLASIKQPSPCQPLDPSQ